MALRAQPEHPAYFESRPFVPEHEDGDEGRFPRPANEPAQRARIRATPFVLRPPSAIPPRRWLYGRHFIRRYVTTTVSPGGFGKTSLLLVEALAMVTGRTLLGVRVPEPMRVWVWNGEDPQDETERRLAAACLHFGIQPEEIGGRLFIDSGRDTPIKIASRNRDATVIAQPVVDDLVAEIRERGVDLLIVDPFVSCHDVPENDNSAIDRVAKAFGHVAEAGNCGVELVHHVRKAGAGQSTYTVEDARGGSALIGAVRSARVLNGMSAEEASQAGIEDRKRRQYFRVDDGKANMQPPTEGASWHHLVSVPLGNDTPEAPGDFVGVVTPWSLPGLLDQISTEQVRAIQAEVDVGEWSESSQAGNWVGRAVAKVLHMDPDDKADATKIKRYLRTWFEGGALVKEPTYDTKKGRTRTAVIVGARV